MNCYLAVWSWKLPDGRRQKITMTFWAHDERAARRIAEDWSHRTDVPGTTDFSFADLSHELSAL